MRRHASRKMIFGIAVFGVFLSGRKQRAEYSDEEFSRIWNGVVLAISKR